MKGIGKAFSRTPHLITSKMGMSKKSQDPEFEEYHRNFQALEGTTEKFIKDVRAFTEAVVALFTAGSGWSQSFGTLFHPITGEYDLIGKNPDCADTVRNVDAWQACMEELQGAIAPELDLIESRVAAPLKEFQGVLKTIRKTITKREHKLTDYDRYNNSLMKLRDKKEKSLSDEKNLFKLEQDFEVATNDYDAINTALKEDMPRFLTLTTAFIDPLFHSFFYMQLNIYYMLLEKTQGFAEGKYDVSNVPGAHIQADYENKRTDAWEHIEALNIVKRILSTQKMVTQHRQLAPPSSGSLVRSTSQLSTSSAGSRTASVTRSATSASTGYKKAPPPPPGSSSAALSRSATTASAPPPYSAGAGAASAAAGKRAPPPPPPLKPKPVAAPAVQYVVALYDYAAQADGDLSFSAGDRIEIVERSENAEDWWTGRLNGEQGVFPGNYVQDT